MNLEIKHKGSTTSLYDGNLEVCKFVTGSRTTNLNYARKIIDLTDEISELKKEISHLEDEIEFYANQS